MNQSTRMPVQREGGSEKAGVNGTAAEFCAAELDNLIDEAIIRWVEAHPDILDPENKESIWKLFRRSKVIYL